MYTSKSFGSNLGAKTLSSTVLNLEDEEDELIVTVHEKVINPIIERIAWMMIKMK